MNSALKPLGWRVVVLANSTDDEPVDYIAGASFEDAKLQALQSLAAWPDATDALVLDHTDKVWEHFKMAAPHF